MESEFMRAHEHWLLIAQEDLAFGKTFIYRTFHDSSF